MVRQKRKPSKNESQDSDEDERYAEENDTESNKESEDDEAPQSISLSTGKDTALLQRDAEREAIDSLREKEKQHRRKNNEFLKRQKEMRQAREKSRISDDILTKVAEKQDSKKPCPATDSEHTRSNLHVTFDDDDNDDDDHEDDHQEDGDKEEQREIHAVVLNQSYKRTRGVLDTANEFLDNHFYGSRLQRVEALEDQNQKRKRTMKPAIKFAKTTM